MAKLKIQIPAPCDYEQEWASKENDCVVIKAYDNKDRDLDKEEK